MASYRKINLVRDDRGLGVSPGAETVALKTSFGVISSLICADIIVTELVEKVATGSYYLFFPMSLTDPNHPKYEDYLISVRLAKYYNTVVVGVSRVSTFGGKKLSSKSAVATPG